MKFESFRSHSDITRGGTDRNGDFATSTSLMPGVTLAAHTGKCKGTGPSCQHACYIVATTYPFERFSQIAPTLEDDTTWSIDKFQHCKMSSTVATAWSSSTWIAGMLCRPASSFRTKQNDARASLAPFCNLLNFLGFTTSQDIKRLVCRYLTTKS